MSDYSRDVTTPLMGATQPAESRRRRRSGATSLQFGNYRVLGLISRGGTCGVYLASHVKTQQRVALKILDPHWGKHDDIVERMFAEHQIASAVSHPGLLSISDAQRAPDGTPYLVMELLDGENLGELVERGRVVVGAIAAIGAQIAAAVAALHDAGIIHCDIKPDNVFLLYERGLEGWPRIKVIDYGVSQRSDSDSSDAIAGTPSCMAPNNGAVARRRSRTSTRSAVSSTGSSPARPRLSARSRSSCCRTRTSSRSDRRRSAKFPRSSSV